MIYRFITITLSFTLFLFATSSMDIDFENTDIGKLPPLWKVSATHSNKDLATWKVEKEDDNNILSLTKINSDSFFKARVFNFCFTKNINFKDGEISVDFRANSGEIDQGGGIMWRVQDRDNYYIARFNPLEDNFRFYSVTNGDRKELKSANIHLKSGWHNMKIVQKGDSFEGYIDGKKLLTYKDSTIKKAGGVGLWTKADAVTSFDNFSVKGDK